VLVLHRLGAGAGHHRQLPRVPVALRQPGGVDLADGVADVDRGAGQLGAAAEELLAEHRQHEAALEALAGRRRRPVEGRVDHPLRRLALLEAEPAGADVGQVGDEGRPPDLLVAVLATGEPLVGLGVVLGVGLERARAADVEDHDRHFHQRVAC
jgi:hypothetical protein